VHSAAKTRQNHCGFLLALVFTVFAAGCIKLDQALIIRDDASGTFEVAYTISEDAVSQARAALKLREQMAGPEQSAGESVDERLTAIFLNPAEDAIRREIKKYAGLGITLDKLEVKSRESSRYVHMKLSFKNLAEVAKADFFRQNGFSLSKNSSGNYVLLREAASKPGNESTSLLPPDAAKLLTPILAGFNVVVNVSVPGKILKTNAHKSAAYSATWSFDLDRDPNAFTALQNQQFNIAFDGRGLNLPQIKLK
jgi:hypothetical protein